MCVYQVCKVCFVEFYLLWTEDQNIEVVRSCTDSQVLWDKPWFLALKINLTWLVLNGKAASMSMYVCLFWQLSKVCVCVCVDMSGDCQFEDRWLFGCESLSLSLWSFSLHLEAVPVGGVFLCQRWGRGDEVTEQQQRKRAGRRKRWTKRLRGIEKRVFDYWNRMWCLIMLQLMIDVIFSVTDSLFSL